PVFQLGVEVGILGRHLGLRDERHFVVGKLLQTDDAAVAALEPGVFIGGQNDEPVAAVLGDDHRLSQRLVRQGAVVLDQIRGRDLHMRYPYYSYYSYHMVMQ